MSRPTWSGAIQFGMVTIPVKMFTAVRPHKVGFNQINSVTGRRIEMRRVDPATGEEVPYEQITKGYDMGGGHYVLIDDEEIAAATPIASRSINVDRFVDIASVNPIYYDQTYYLGPDQIGAIAFSVLRDALTQTNKAAVGTVVIRNREHLVLIRPEGQVLACSTLHWADEVSPPVDIPVPEISAGAKEVGLATHLIASMSEDFDIGAYQDNFTTRIRELISLKAQGAELPVVEERPVLAAGDLMAALAASLEAVGQPARTES